MGEEVVSGQFSVVSSQWSVKAQGLQPLGFRSTLNAQPSTLNDPLHPIEYVLGKIRK